MSVTVELFKSDLAEVTFRPSLWRRILLRQDTVIRFAVRTRGGAAWWWDDKGRWIEDRDVLVKLWRAVADADELKLRRSLERAARDYTIDDLTEN